jgi:putative DNA primase/helicase
MSALSYGVLVKARRGARSIVADIACPICGPTRPPQRAKRKVMRTWLTTSGVITYRCARCEERGYAFPDGERRIETPSTEQRAAADADEARQRQRKIEAADWIWREAVPIAGTAGAAYLAHRGIDLDQMSNHGGLGFHPRCPWGASDHLPCILARYTDAITGELRGIRRRPIRDGEKAKTLGPMGGCVIRLWPDEGVTQGLCLAEGVETAAFGATRATYHNTLLQPMWAAGSAGNMETFPVLPGIDALTLLVDHDESGEKAAHVCGERWRRAGREVTLLTPKQIGADFNDLRALIGSV